MTPAPASGALTVIIVTTAVLLGMSAVFAALTLVLRARNALKAAEWARIEKTWTQPILDVLAGDRAPETVTGSLAGTDRLFFAGFLARLARRLKGPEQDALYLLAAPVLDAVTRPGARASAERRARAIQSVGDLGGERHTWALLEALDDPSPLVVMTAVRALARRGRPEHLDAVIARLHRFDDWSYGFLAATLASFGPEAAPQLRWALADASQSAASRIVAAEALHLLHDLESAATAAAVAQSAEETDLAAASLRLLSAVGTAEQAPGVRKACQSPNPAIRAQAFAALSALGDRQDLPRVREALRDPSPWVALRAAETLKALDPSAAQRAAADQPGESVAALALAE